MPRWAIDFTPRIDAAAISEVVAAIDAQRTVLARIPLPPALAQQLDRLNIIRQIKGTTGIEGNTLSETEVSQVLSSSPSQRQTVTHEEQEVLNAEMTLQYIRDYIARQSEGVITESLIRELHKQTTQNCDYDGNTPGKFRTFDVVAGEYRAPDTQDVSLLMQRFVEFINSGEAVMYGPLVRALLAHFYLISIHPFADGNGRTSRALEAFILAQAGYNVRGFYSLANFFYQHREEYIQQLQDARFRYHGNLTQFLLFALRGYQQELHTLEGEILRLVAPTLLLDACKDLYQQKRLNERNYLLMEYLIQDAPGGIDYAAYRHRTHHVMKAIYAGVSDKTLQRDLQELQRESLVLVDERTLKPNFGLLTQPQ